MKLAEIERNGHYVARVGSRVTVVRVIEALVTREGKTYWRVMNTVTGRVVVFRSALRFKHVAGRADGYYTQADYRPDLTPATAAEKRFDEALARLNGSAASHPA